MYVSSRTIDRTALNVFFQMAFSVKPNRSSDTDVYICSTGRVGATDRAQITSDLWAANIRAEFHYDDDMALEEVQKYCRQASIPWLVLIKDKFYRQAGTVRVRNLEKKSEWEIPFSELAEFLNSSIYGHKGDQGVSSSSSLKWRKTSDAIAGPSSLTESISTTSLRDVESTAAASMPPSNPTEVNFVFLGQMSKTSKASKAKQQQIKPYQVDKMKEKVYQKVLPVLQHIAGPKPTELVAVDITREATRKLMDAGFQYDDLVRRSMCRML